MKKRFVAKNSNKPKRVIKFRYLIYIVIIYFSYNLSLYIDLNKNINISNETFLKVLLGESNHHILYKYSSNNIISKAISFFSGIKINEPTTILNRGLGNVADIDKQNNDMITKLVYNDDYKELEKLQDISEYIKDPNPVEVKQPLVYIYNTHQLENYSMKNLQIYNIKPNVMMTSFILREKLNKLGISSMAEEGNFTEFLRINSWTHKDSYKVSKVYIKDAIAKNTSLKYFVDVHRDSVSRNQSTITINNKVYAKVMFVVGLENPKYQSNLTIAKSIHSLIEKKHKGLSKGILTKKGPGVDGVYNQDLSPNMMLIEFGGVDNSIEEVLNTTEIIADVLAEYIKGDKL
jgi:stage II sporulation protein P